MIIKTTPGTLEKGLRTDFLGAFADAGVRSAEMVRMLTTVIPSTAPFEKYEWLGEVPSVKEFLDQRDVGDLSSTDYTVTNQTWESTLQVDRDQVSDGRLTGIGIRLREMASRAAFHPLRLFFETLVANGTGYDSAAVFANSHAARGEQTAAQDNLLAGTGTTVAAFKTDLQSAIAAMTQVVDESNDPFFEMINGQDLVVVVPPELEFIAKEAIRATIISNTTNIMTGAVRDVVVAPGNLLTDADDWYLLNVGHEMKAFIFQEREPISFEALESGDAAFHQKVWSYGTYARYTCAPGMWQFANKTVN